jgi:hypothetical protein
MRSECRKIGSSFRPSSRPAIFPQDTSDGAGKVPANGAAISERQIGAIKN